MTRTLLVFSIGAIACGRAAGPGASTASTGTITGRIVLAGMANASGATVFVVGASATATTDTTGDYTLADVPTGTRTLVAIANGYDPGTAGGLRVAAAATTTAPTLTLEPSGEIVSIADAGVSPPALASTATLLGRPDSSGTLVSIAGTSISTTTAADGTWTIPDAPIGWVTLRFAHGEYQATVPDVLSLPGSNGAIIDGTTYPLLPMDVPRGTRVFADAILEAARPPSPWVIVENEESSPAGYSVVSAETGAGFPLDPATVEAQLAPGGGTVLYWVESPSVPSGFALDAVPATGGTPVTLSTTATYSETPSPTTPDGTVVFYVAPVDGENTLMSQPVTGGAATALLGVFDDFDSASFAVSPDSSTIAICVNAELWAMPVDQPANASNALASLDGDCLGPMFTPDGSTIVFYAYDFDLGTWAVESIDAQDGPSAPAMLFFSSDLNPGLLLVSPDGTAVATTVTDGLEYVPLIGGSPFFLTATAEPESPAFTPDSSYLVFGDGSELMAADANGSSRVLFSVPEGHWQFALSPTADTAIVAADGLYAVDVPTGAITVLASGEAWDAQVSADGSLVTFLSQGPLGTDVSVVSIDGQTGAVPELYVFESASFFLLNDSTLVASRYSTPEPYTSAMDGVYRVPLGLE